MSQSILKAAAGVAALVAIAFGASAVAGTSSGSSSGTGEPGRMAGPGGQMPPGPPGFGQPVTDAAASKAGAAVLAKYPGQLERVERVAGGGYVAHVFRTGGSEVHVLVNSRFQVTGLATRQGDPGAPPPRQGEKD
jgi:hypothetical protein